VEEESYPEPTAAVDDVLEQVHLLWRHMPEPADQLRLSEAHPLLCVTPGSLVGC